MEQASWLAPTCDRQYDPEYGIAVGTLTAPLYYWQVTSADPRSTTEPDDLVGHGDHFLVVAGANKACTGVDRESGYLKVYR